jgi:hypothetical protein
MGKLLQINRALDAKRLTRMQHSNAAQELFAVMSADQANEVSALVLELTCGVKNSSAEPKGANLTLVADQAKPAPARRRR